MEKDCSNCKHQYCICDAVITGINTGEPAEYGCQYADEYLLEDGCEKWEEA